MKNLLIFTLIALFGISCSSKQRFIVLRDVPVDPSFIVIPANNTLGQVEFANEVEAALISSKVSVRSRPAIKNVQLERQVGSGTVSEGNKDVESNSNQATLIERYRSIELNSDYVVNTYSNSGRIVIKAVESGEVLASFTIKEEPNDVEKAENLDTIKDALEALGIEKKDPQN